MADKMTDRVAKPATLVQKMTTIYLITYFVYISYLIWLKHHSIAYSNKIFKYIIQDGKKMAYKVSKPAN